MSDNNFDAQISNDELEREIQEAAQTEREEKPRKEVAKSKPKRNGQAIAKASGQAQTAIASNAENLVNARKQSTRKTAEAGIIQAKRDARVFNDTYQATLLGELSKAAQANSQSLVEQVALLDDHVDSEVDLSDIYDHYGVSRPLEGESDLAPTQEMRPFTIFG